MVFFSLAAIVEAVPTRLERCAGRSETGLPGHRVYSERSILLVVVPLSRLPVPSVIQRLSSRDGHMVNDSCQTEVSCPRRQARS